MEKFEPITNLIIGHAIEVHRVLGPGLLEKTYQECLAYELRKANLEVKKEVPLPVIYKSVNLDCGYRIDLLVNDFVIIEVKSVEKLIPVHSAQLLTYMKLSHVKIGLLINFNQIILKDGLKRFVL